MFLIPCKKYEEMCKIQTCMMELYDGKYTSYENLFLKTYNIEGWGLFVSIKME